MTAQKAFLVEIITVGVSNSKRTSSRLRAGKIKEHFNFET
jgi:hypothetical protein